MNMKSKISEVIYQNGCILGTLCRLSICIAYIVYKLHELLLPTQKDFIENISGKIL